MGFACAIRWLFRLTAKPDPIHDNNTIVGQALNAIEDSFLYNNCSKKEPCFLFFLTAKADDENDGKVTGLFRLVRTDKSREIDDIPFSGETAGGQLLITITGDPNGDFYVRPKSNPTHVMQALTRHARGYIPDIVRDKSCCHDAACE